MEFTLKQAKELVEMFSADPDIPEETITVIEGDKKSHSGAGLYAYWSEYPEEGAMLLG